MVLKRSFPLALALALGCTQAQTPPSKSVTPERELLERLATPYYDPASTTAQVLVGQLPADLGFALPAGSRVIGSVSTQSKDPNYPSGVTVYFDTALTPRAVAEQFARTLSQGGWKVFPTGRTGPFEEGGFQTSEPFAGRQYYRESPDQTVNVVARQAGQVTQVTLLKQSSPNLKQQLRYAQAGSPGYSLPLPTLSPPADSTVTPRGGGSGGDDVTQSVGIESGLSRTALQDHYAGQLKKAGWKLSNRAETGKLISTLWTFTQEGKQRAGLFLLTETGAGQYRATLATQGLE